MFKTWGRDIPGFIKPRTTTVDWEVTVIKPSDFHTPQHYFTPSEIEKDEPIEFSYICCGGNSAVVPYSMFLIKGCEREFFVMEGKKYKFSEMISGVTRRGQLMKKILSNNAKYILFEMQDRSIYELDIFSKEMTKFFIPHTGLLNCVGSGITSNCWLAQTTNGKVFERNEDGKVSEIEFPYPKVKQFACFCFSAQFFLLENNQLLIRNTAHGFQGETGQLREVTSPQQFKIKYIEAGFAHLVLHLQDGQILVRGLNSSQQCNTNTNQRTVDVFERLNVSGPVQQVYCSSVTTAIRNESKFIFFGLNHQWKPDVNIEDERETIAFGPWHGFIYRKSFEEAKCDDEYFCRQLQNQLKILKFSDILIRNF